MKTAPFKLRSGNKPEVAKMMGVSPAKKVLDEVTVSGGEKNKRTDVTEDYKTRGNKSTREHIKKGGKVFKNSDGSLSLVS